MDESGSPAEGVTAPPPTPIKPDFARERANLVWKGYSEVATALEAKAKKAVGRPTEASLRVGRMMEAGKGVLRYQNSILGLENKPLKPRSLEKPHPRTYLRKKLGAERYRAYISDKRGDPTPNSTLRRNAP